LITQLKPEDAFGNNSTTDILTVAEKVLSAKVAAVKGETKNAYELFTKAIESEDALIYNEPLDWDLPTRELFGALLLKNGENLEAEKVFRAELAKHPRNGRALFGLALSLRQQGKGREAEATQQEFHKQWAGSDVRLTLSDLAGFK